MGKNKINVIVTGGKLDRVSLSYGGATAWATVRKISVDKAFFSCNGVGIDRGASEVAEIHAEFKENALQYCNEKILMCDASKLGVRSSRFFADFDMIDRVITDSSADASFISKLKSSGVPVE
jgi:DeoR/GlpR family transcriptional regulator of sugar metabolism